MLNKEQPPVPPTTLPHEKLTPIEFNQRVSRLLLVCIEGLCKLVPQKEYLYDTLNDLGRVIKKAVQQKPITGIAREIEDYFIRLALENKFRETKKDVMKQIVFDLMGTIQEFAAHSSQFDSELENAIQELESTDNLGDLIKAKEKIVGTLGSLRKRSSTLKTELEDHRKTTEILTQQLEKTEAVALVDSLTNALNRNAYNLKIGQMVRDYERFKEPFALMVVDIDHFKNFNDQYGHKAGDKVLHSVAGNIQRALRTSDLVFRYGGEEFVVLINKISLENANRLGEKIRQQVEKDYYLGPDNKTLKVTVSVGVTCSREGDNEVSLFDRADQAMYEAKRKGRNLVQSQL